MRLNMGVEGVFGVEGSVLLLDAVSETSELINEGGTTIVAKLSIAEIMRLVSREEPHEFRLEVSVGVDRGESENVVSVLADDSGRVGSATDRSAPFFSATASSVGVTSLLASSSGL